MKCCAGRKETKQKIGTLRLNIAEVVRNGKIRDSWALQVRAWSFLCYTVKVSIPITPHESVGPHFIL